jgi:hypothetical protein
MNGADQLDPPRIFFGGKSVRLLRRIRTISPIQRSKSFTFAILGVSEEGKVGELMIHPITERRRLPYAIGFLIVSLLSATAVPGETAYVEPLSQVSGASPFAGCTADSVPFQPGVNTLNSEVEPWIGVNPTNPLNLVATWQQDRWSNGGARGLVVATSFDGGETWEMVPIPGLTPCTGGGFLRASDPWLSFAPNGELYHIALAFTGGIANSMVVSKSTNGGRDWSAPKPLIVNIPPLFNDKESITADPNDPDFVYAVWDRLDFVRNLGPTLFTRTTNGGLTWEPARVIYNPGFAAQTVANQIVVGPEGTVYNVFTEIFNFPSGVFFLSLKRSFDRGQTWTPPSAPIRAHQLRPMSAVDPDLGIPVRDGAFLFDAAVDPRNGSLYLVWQDGSLSGFRYPAIAFSRSADGGMTWSSPIAVNQTPPAAGNRQAFIPSVEVSAQGTVAVSYYDFRFNGTEPGALTDYWMTWCHPEASDCTNPERWQHEVRLTDASFDLLRAPFANGLFIGDYVGLAAAGGDFVNLFTQPHGTDRSSAFARRVVIEAAAEPLGLGFWKHQVRVARTGRGEMEEGGDALLEYLEDIHALFDRFDADRGLAGLQAVLNPPEPADPQARTERQVMALLLNLTSARLSPWVVVRDGKTVADEVAFIIAVLEDPAASRLELEAAKDLAEAINSGILPMD